MKNVLFVASEGVPYMKTGGLGDVIGTLPKYFPKDAFDARVILPLYECMDEKYKKSLKKVADVQVNVFGANNEGISIFETTNDGIITYFIASGRFNGSKPYGETYDDINKFAFFCKAVIEAINTLEYKPDIIHCHDWQSALVPAYVKELAKTNEYYANVKTIMTIHNLRFQGCWDKGYIQYVSGLSDEYLGDDYLGYYDSARLLKGGIAYADHVTTVSETYAQEIMTPFFGEELDGLLSYRMDELTGIVNGIDYDIFNPETDSALYKNFSVANFRREKVKNKTKLQAELGLEVDPKVMTIGLISRLTDQKGIDLIAYIMDDLCQDAVQLIVLGTGEEKYESMFKHYAWKYPNKVSVTLAYSEELSHKIYGATDAFLMPSLFEPCGLSQMMAMRYGSIPIVRETGGLKDTVQPYNEYEHTGNGFSFANYNAHEMLGTTRYAQRIFYDKKRDWNKIVERSMSMDYSWPASASKYVKLYDSLTD